MDALRLTLDESGLEPFRRAWREAVEGIGARSDAAALADEAVRCLGEAPGDQPAFVRERIAEVPAIAAMIGDARWSAPEAVRRDLLGALAYFADPRDLIPDQRPRFGLLDDALVIELALRAHPHEWRAWREFDDFRRAHPELDGLDRDGWMQIRRQQLREAMRRPRARHYLDGADASRFHRERHSYLAEDDVPRFGIH